jgi:hypothetical protein
MFGEWGMRLAEAVAAVSDARVRQAFAFCVSAPAKVILRMFFNGDPRRMFPDLESVIDEVHSALVVTALDWMTEHTLRIEDWQNDTIHYGTLIALTAGIFCSRRRISSNLEAMLVAAFGAPMAVICTQLQSRLEADIGEMDVMNLVHALWGGRMESASFEEGAKYIDSFVSLAHHMSAGFFVPAQVITKYTEGVQGDAAQDEAMSPLQCELFAQLIDVEAFRNTAEVVGWLDSKRGTIVETMQALASVSHAQDVPPVTRILKAYLTSADAEGAEAVHGLTPLAFSALDAIAGGQDMPFGVGEALLVCALEIIALHNPGGFQLWMNAVVEKIFTAVLAVYPEGEGLPREAFGLLVKIYKKMRAVGLCGEDDRLAFEQIVEAQEELEEERIKTE